MVPRNLRASINRGPVEPAVALKILQQLLKALAFAHWRVGDCAPITPETVLFTEEGTAVLAGCGLDDISALRFEDETAAESLSDRPKGGSLAQVDPAIVHAVAPYYRAPEQVHDGSRDERSDVFVVGMIFYEMVTGRHPFGASDGLGLAAVEERILSKAAYEIPRNLMDGWPTNVPALLDRALAKDPKKRFPDALGFLDALDGGTVAPAATVAVPDAVKSSRLRKYAKRRRARALSYALGGVVVIVLAVVAAFMTIDGGKAASRTTTTVPISSIVPVAPVTTAPVTTATTTAPVTITLPPAPPTTVFERTQYPADDPLIAYAGTWAQGEQQADAPAGVATADSIGASVTIAFEGTYLAYLAERSPAGGLAEVTLDGKRLGTIDLYSAEPASVQKVWGSGQLKPGPHTVTISWTGDKNADSNGTRISLAELDVVGILVKVR